GRGRFSLLRVRGRSQRIEESAASSGDVETVWRLRPCVSMRRCLTLVVGVLIGQWLTFGASSSPADLYSVGLAAWERRDYPEALRRWSDGTALQPGPAVPHFW